MRSSKKNKFVCKLLNSLQSRNCRKLGFSKELCGFQLNLSLLCNFSCKLFSRCHYCLMSSSIRHLFLGLFSTKSILSASLSSSCSLQLSSFSPSPSPSSSCFRFAVASSAACLLRHFVRRFWNQTWWREKNYWKLIIKKRFEL